MRELFRALEEKKRVVALLDRFLENSQGQVASMWVWKTRIPPCAS